MDTVGEKKPDRYFYILFEEHIWECDGYLSKEDGKEPEWMILITCPVCRQNLNLSSRKKKLLLDEKGLHLAEPIACSYPGEFGGLCNFSVMLEPPTKSEDKTCMVNGPGGRVKVIVDAVAKRV